MRTILRTTAITLVILGLALPGVAEERYKKWTIELSFGGYDPVDEVRSNAANRAIFTNNDGTVASRADPRPDLAQKNSMSIDSSSRIDLRLGFGVAEWGWGELILDSGVGYIDGDLRGLEIAFQVTDNVDVGEAFAPWSADFLNVGKLEQVPVSLDALVRFRPTKRMNPYAGIGVGYRFVEFQEDPEFTDIAEFLDGSRGRPLIPTGDGNARVGSVREVQRPRVEAPDTFYYQARLGMEWQLSPHWSIYLDTRYEWADDPVRVVINKKGDTQLGRATPNGPVDLLYPFFGTPFEITEPAAKGPGAYKRFPDSGGNWFVEGGELDYGGFSFGVGARFGF